MMKSEVINVFLDLTWLNAEGIQLSLFHIYINITSGEAPGMWRDNWSWPCWWTAVTARRELILAFARYSYGEVLFHFVINIIWKEWRFHTAFHSSVMVLAKAVSRCGLPQFELSLKLVVQCSHIIEKWALEKCTMEEICYAGHMMIFVIIWSKVERSCSLTQY